MANVALLMKNHGLAPSLSQAKRLIIQGSVRVNGERVTDIDASVKEGVHELRVGKHVVEIDNG